MLLSLVARYWAIFGGDAWYVRAAVVLSAVYAFADTAINCTWAYRWAVSDFLRPADLMQLPWQVTSFCICLGTTAWAVQTFYLVRLFFLSRRNWIICVPIGLLINACLALSLYMAHYCSQHTDIVAAFDHLTHFVTPWMASALATGQSKASNSGRNKADRAFSLFGGNFAQTLRPCSAFSVPRKIMQTNAPSTLFQLAIVCLHYRVHTGLGFLYLGFCSSKIYLGTFIATCNARDPHGSLSFDETVNTCRLKGLGPSKLPPVHVAIQQERRVDGEEDEDDVSSSTAAGGKSEDGIKGGSKPEADVPLPRESVQFQLEVGSAESLPPHEQQHAV
ncbi:hypothetical protein C6P46_007140 [Rhodotorula mucilaginosa]|uniref:Uncharacterized protein n=1 Tax=Rhodotorula mucilaginosa TaxID=5537 RepID=A0A9P6VVV2_RHOMI|nr:hypothetical protein C6P46_007140 [Rhodotorula mucilaginosa]